MPPPDPTIPPQLVSTQPEHAVTKGIAAGSNGQRVGVYGKGVKNVGVYGASDQGIGVYGTGGALAAKFDGDIEVNGAFRLNSQDLGQQVAALRSAVAFLEQQMVGVAGRLDRTQPVVDAQPLPYLASVQAVGDEPGGRRYAVVGEGFFPGGRVTVRVVDRESFRFEQIVTALPDGRLPPPYIVVPTLTSNLYFAATDGRPNPHDLSGVRWSNTRSA